ncbi:MAG: ComF family protein [Pseudomonadota bacterium]
MQTLMRMIYPSQCLTCGELVVEDFSLCGKCWGKTSFITGLTCASCGVPLIGDDAEGAVQCDDCIRTARPWSCGASALLYRGNGRKIVLALKHGDRTDLAGPAAQWMVAIMPVQTPGTVVVPVPLHWLRFLKRRYNQAALLGKHVAQLSGLEFLPDALVRTRSTKPLDGHSREARFKSLQDAISPHPKRGSQLEGRRVLLIDDVMTSGATLAAATEACLDAGADHVDVLTLARVAKDV